MYAISLLSLVPVRKEASDRSEMVTQLLFGELVEVVDKQGSWRKIRCLYDDYPGWVDVKQLTQISEEERARIGNEIPVLTLDIVQLVQWEKHQILPVLLGSNLPAYADKQFKVNDLIYQYEGQVYRSVAPDPGRLIENAYMYLNAPYLWGGRSPFGIDCSGYTQMIMKLSGIRIPRDAAQQAEQGTTIHLTSEIQSGDLAFFDNEEGKIVHTGILLTQDRIIHASGKVRIDKFDHEGIYNVEQKKYTHKLRLLKRFH